MVCPAVGLRPGSFPWVQGASRGDSGWTLGHDHDRSIQHLGAMAPVCPVLVQLAGVCRDLLPWWADR